MKDYTIANFCCSRSWGGLEMNVHRQSSWLIERGHNIITYCDEESPLWNACVDDNLPVCPFNSQNKKTDLLQLPRFIKNLKKNNSKILILHMNPNFLVTALAKRFSGNFFKFIYEQHMHVGVTKKDFFHNWIYSHLDLWLATVPFLKRAVLEKTNIPEEKIKIVHRGIEIDRFVTNQPDKITARKKLNLPLDETIVGVIGRIDPQKGQHLLIEAAAKLHNKGYKIHLMFTGANTANEEFGYEKKLHDLTKEFNLTDYVHFFSFQKKQEQAMAALDIMAMTTNSETYGMVTIEAMASNRLVIGSNAGGTLDLINDNHTGLHFQTGDSNSLADKLIYALDNKEKMIQLARAGREFIINNYSNTRQIELLEKVFDSLI